VRALYRGGKRGLLEAHLVGNDTFQQGERFLKSAERKIEDGVAKEPYQ